MKPSLTFYSYQVSFVKKLEDISRLCCLRVCLFFLTASFRHCGTSTAIALLLFFTGASGEPIDLTHSQPTAVLFFGCRLLSILLGLIWMSLSLCGLLVRLINAATWKQEMQHTENCLRYRISALEDWLVLPTQSHYRYGEVIEVPYHQHKQPTRIRHFKG